MLHDCELHISYQEVFTMNPEYFPLDPALHSSYLSQHLVLVEK